MSYISRAKVIIQNIKRFDAGPTSDADLSEFGQAVLYQPTSRVIWNRMLVQNGLIIDPATPNILDAIGTDSSGVFVASLTSVKDELIAGLVLRLLRKHMSNCLVAYRLNFAIASAVPLPQAESTIRSNAATDALAIIGGNEDDPSS